MLSAYPISNAAIGAIDRVGPNPPTPISATPFPDKVTLSWTASADNANGVGVMQYWVYRDGTLLTKTSGTTFTDEPLAPGATYNYSVYAEDWHGSLSSAATASATTTSFGLGEPRRIGIQPTGAYWGTMGEQIDMLSGNLNFTLPLLKVVGRGSWSKGFALSYNSQLWSGINGTTIRHGADVGYGYGWRLLAGSIIPHYSDPYTISHYVITDSTGAEYKLDVHDGTIWRGMSGFLAYYDENLHRIYFNDGSFWQMDCISAGNEQDAGTRYPTVMQDSNGNQVSIRYRPAIGSGTINTSARIQEIEDIRAVYNNWNGVNAYRTFQFTYNNDAIPHLTGITNNINTGETYDFSYSGPLTIVSPFNSANTYAAQKVLSWLTVPGTSPLTHTFYYDSTAGGTAGELIAVYFPYGGELRYQYSTSTLAGGRQLREVLNRWVVKQPGADWSLYAFFHDAGDSSRPVHLYTNIVDFASSASKTWFFSQATNWTMGLATTYLEQRTSDWASLSAQAFVWALAPSGFPYIADTTQSTDPNSANEKVKRLQQTLDGYGNVLQKAEYDYGNLTTPARTTNCTYVTNTGWTSRYLRNLPISCSLTAGAQTYTLFTNQYDISLDNTNLMGLRLHDSANYGPSFGVRGNLSSWSRLGGQSAATFYTMAGGRLWWEVNNVRQTATSFDGQQNLPTALTAIGVQSTLSYTSFLGVSNATASNGPSVTFSYDGLARPATQSSPDGNITLTYTNSPPTKTATIGGVWTKTTYDGFGRTIKEEQGDAGGAKSIVDTEYAPCACSPLGKVSRVSRPYAPGGTVYWTTYTYDAVGRTLTVTQPNSSGTTTYIYEGNTVKVTDPAGRWKKYATDAFGNLTQVNEPNPQGGADFVTTYTYNALSKLTQVSMPRGGYTQTRTFVYNMQGQLTSETHPESGTTTYTYGSFGRVATKTDAKNQRTEWSYGAYGRTTQERHYNPSNQEQVCEQLNYRYDTYSPSGTSDTYSWGRLTEVQWGVENPATCGAGKFTEQYGYDQYGRMNGKALRFRRDDPNREWLPNRGEAVLRANWTYSFGKMTQLSYPATSEGLTLAEYRNGASASYTLDSLKRLASETIQPNDGSPTYTLADQIQYGVAGELSQIRYNNVTEVRGYNALGQLTGISYNGTLRHDYRYSGTVNDGRLTSYKNWQSGEEVQYQYDTLARLTSAQTIGPEWGQSYGYDGFGSLVSKTVTKGTATTLSVTADPATNRISGLTYDANGNVTNMPGVGVMAYDGRNRFVGSIQWPQLPTRGYDPGNRKIWTSDGNGEIFVDFYLPSGEKLGTYRTFTHGGYAGTIAGGADTCYRPNNDQKYCIAFGKVGDNFYFSGRLLKSQAAWVQEDRLGSTVSHLPYGEERTPTAQERVKFATYWRESSGLIDYAHNRYYSNSYGRFLSPDPYRASAALTNPQSWNRYAYVENDPVNKNDPSGLYSNYNYMATDGWGVWGSAWGVDVWGLLPWQMFMDLDSPVFVDPWASWPIIGGVPGPLPEWTYGYASATQTLEQLSKMGGWIGTAAKAALLVGITWHGLEALHQAKLDAEDREGCEKVAYPGDPGGELEKPVDARKPPGKGWEWRGPDDKGQWHNPTTGESMRPHPQDEGHKPHWDYTGPNKSGWRKYGPNASDCEKK